MAAEHIVEGELGKRLSDLLPVITSACAAICEQQPASIRSTVCPVATHVFPCIMLI